MMSYAANKSSRPINVLPADLANKIAAGEVIERPASVVKELVENAIDAGATQIEVEARDGGKELIRVTDNGRGIGRDEIPVAFLRHATSKIASIDELSAVLSLGFRGEALPSIASCSETEMTSCPAGGSAARIVIRGGVAEAVKAAAGPPGTTVIVRRLFYNTPARYKFLKQGATEKRYIAEYVTNMALAHPEVAFRLLGDNSLLLSTPGSSDLLAAIAAVHGPTIAKGMIPVAWECPYVQVSGFVSPPAEARANRTQETIFVNGRWVQNRLLYSALEKGYDTMLEHRRYPVAVLHLGIDPSLLDVNVHPAKTEIRFQNEGETFKNVMLAVRGALTGANIAPRIDTAPRDAYQSMGLSHIQHQAPRSLPVSAWPQVSAAGLDKGLFVAESQPVPITAECPVPMYGQVHAAGERPVPTYGQVHAAGGLTQNFGQTFAAAPQTELQATLSADDTPELLAHMRAPLAHVEAPTEAAAVREFLRQAPVLGQVLNTYLALATPFGLWLIDQHVAHERVLFERALTHKISQSSQMLLVPVSVQLSPAEAAMAESAADELVDMGFSMEPFGGSTLLVRAVPLHLAGPPSAASLRELLMEVMSAWESSGPSRKERVAAMIACKAAVKAGQRLDPSAQQALLRALSQAENPFACPHGRPIMIALDQAELERRFGRR